jgi:uncharacterized C2H2 Zn-finger protein
LLFYDEKKYIFEYKYIYLFKAIKVKPEHDMLSSLDKCVLFFKKKKDNQKGINKASRLLLLGEPKTNLFTERQVKKSTWLSSRPSEDAINIESLNSAYW